MGTPLAVAEAETDIRAKAAAYGIASAAVDGMDVIAVEVAASRALEEIRAGGGPRFLECRTYRLRAHSMFDAQLYRDKAEIEQWKAREPISRFRGWLAQSGLVFEEEVARLEAAAEAEVAGAVAFAEAGGLEPVAALERFVTMDEVPA
jgi:TPP-dependent pyruvate/acetoin dehydrogenase alpha subunit